MKNTRSKLIPACVAAAAVAVALAAPGFDPVPAAAKQTRRPWFHGGVKVADLPVARTEISGLAAPQRPENAAYLWCIEDGALSRLTAINRTTGADAGAWTASGITTSDVEECTSARVQGQPYLYILDTGDNANARSTFKVLRCKEPVITGSNANFPGGDVEEIVCQFPGANVPSHKDVEGVFAEPLTGDLYFLTKRITPILCYRLPHAASYAGTQTLDYLGAISNDGALNTLSTTPSGNNGYVTGAAMAPNGTEILVRSYDRIARFGRNLGTQTVYQALSGTPAFLPCMADPAGSAFMAIQTNSEPQGEAICFDRAGLHYYTCSELVATHGGGSGNYPLFRFQRAATATTTYSFQDGIAAYSGTLDTYLDSGAATTPQTTAASLVADYDYSAFPTVSRTRQCVVKWDVSAIPSSATVVRAYVEFYVNTEGLGLRLFKVLSSWVESDTWNTLSSGIQVDGIDAVTTPDALWGPTAAGGGMDTYTGYIHINISPDTAQDWVTAPANNKGLLVTGPVESTGDGIQIDSREGATAARRPRLVIVTIP
jgi:hypothetical protein